VVLGLEGIAVSVAIGTKMRRRIREPDGALLGCAGKIMYLQMDKFSPALFTSVSSYVQTLNSNGHYIGLE
jgi:hypothetical protein